MITRSKQRSHIATGSRAQASDTRDQVCCFRSGALLVVALLASITLAAPASAIAAGHQAAIHVVLVDHDQSISERAQERATRALTVQVNRDLRSYWPGPRVAVKVAKSARAAGWRLDVEPLSVNAGVSGRHGENRRGVWAKVYPSSGVPWTWAASHELLEMLEDPTGHTWTGAAQREICDPVENVGYDTDGVIVSDFVTPAYFTPGSRGPWDYIDWLTGPVLP